MNTLQVDTHTTTVIMYYTAKVIIELILGTTQLSCLEVCHLLAKSSYKYKLLCMFFPSCFELILSIFQLLCTTKTMAQHRGDIKLFLYQMTNVIVAPNKTY